MSTIKERAEAEALAAEAEDPEVLDPEDAPEPEPDESEPEPEPEPEPPMSEKEVEVLGRKMDSESLRHEKRVKELLGASWTDWKECPLCPVPGYVPAAPIGEVDPMLRLAVLDVLGDARPPDLRHAADYYTCDACDGWGDVLTGARKDTTRAVQCDACGGYGYKRRSQDQAMQATIAHAVQAPPPLVSLPPANGAEDQWGRAPGHPHYGIDPKYAGL